MKLALDPISEAATEAARAALPEQVTVGAATLLPRGADPFTGTERPLLLGVTRWSLVAPGGVMLGGSPAGIAAVLGFDLPERPVPVPAEERGPNDSPPPRYADLVIEAARQSATTFTHAVADSVAHLAGLPADCAATQVSMNDTEAAVRAEVGPLPDAVVVLLHAEAYDVRLVIVVPGIFAARIGHAGADADADEASASAGNATEADAASAADPSEAPGVRRRASRGALEHALSAVPVDLAIELGHAHVPLAHVLQLRDGEVLELHEAIDAPVALVSGSTPVARGDLGVTDAGNLVLNVTSIPGRADPAAPRVMVDRRGGEELGEVVARADADRASVPTEPGADDAGSPASAVADAPAGEPPVDAPPGPDDDPA